jgi:hypothetical protein
MSESRSLYDKKDASFANSPPPSCVHAVTGVAVHGATFQVGYFALLCAEGPACIGQNTGLFSGSQVWIRVQLLGRVSDLVDLLPADELRDEVRLSQFLYT